MGPVPPVNTDSLLPSNYIAIIANFECGLHQCPFVGCHKGPAAPNSRRRVLINHLRDVSILFSGVNWRARLTSTQKHAQDYAEMSYISLTECFLPFDLSISDVEVYEAELKTARANATGKQSAPVRRRSHVRAPTPTHTIPSTPSQPVHVTVQTPPRTPKFTHSPLEAPKLPMPGLWDRDNCRGPEVSRQVSRDTRHQSETTSSITPGQRGNTSKRMTSYQDLNPAS